VKWRAAKQRESGGKKGRAWCRGSAGGGMNGEARLDGAIVPRVAFSQRIGAAASLAGRRAA